MIYNDYVMGESDYHEDLLLREWEFYSLYMEPMDDEEEENIPEDD